ncbi:GNAT family N-acetyltransferase [Streptomyces showdoensis]|uniref:GNAT family N-acetyltransferase n=1 Tax=Streptomyces showdoensis TaxID=68268 RepID=UPI000F4F8C52|nr:GNAT family N-acetyltransferase [Streptomyces showdoensis]
MTIVCGKPRVDELGDVVDILRDWQDDGAPMQLHPGDLGWFWRSGAEATADAVRTWRRDERVLAVGLLDGAELLRVTLAPDARHDPDLAQQIHDDVTDPRRGVLPEGSVSIEAPGDALIRDVLLARGWYGGEPWTSLRRDLTEPVEDSGLRIEVVTPGNAHRFAAVLRAAFDGSTFTDARWRAMTAGSPYTDARSLLAYDDKGNAVASVTVWSAGRGRPGLLEPMGVHRAHRHLGHGRAITIAAAAALRELGSSSALVGTPSSNVGAVATYESAGFRRRPDVRDVCRDGGQDVSSGPAGQEVLTEAVDGVTVGLDAR